MSLGLYIHIPFCRKRCTYCDFHFSTNRSRQTEMIQAIAEELCMRKGFGKNEGVLRTVYLGGGTPSLLNEEELDVLFGEIHKHFTIAKDAEITLEANPEDLNAETLTRFQRVGINRLSIGIQSFAQADLDWMNRAHTPEEAASCVATARDAGITDITIDLMFGLPGMNLERWHKHVEKAIRLSPDHISLYALSIEKKTALKQLVQKGKMALPPDELVETQYLLAHKLLTERGFKHYELSSFARPGKEAKHNTGYWQGLPYLGIGPSAHSFDGKYRSWNHAHNAHYLDAISKGNLPVEEVEQLSDVERYNEYIMTRMRLAEGLSLPTLEARFETVFWEDHAPYIDSLIRAGQLWRKSDQIGLTPRGWIVSDSILSEFFK